MDVPDSPVRHVARRRASRRSPEGEDPEAALAHRMRVQMRTAPHPPAASNAGGVSAGLV